MTRNLTEIRCPFKRKSKSNNKIYDCNYLCVKVYAPSSGEAFCMLCKMSFEFDVNNQSHLNTGVRAKPVNI